MILFIKAGFPKSQSCSYTDFHSLRFKPPAPLSKLDNGYKNVGGTLTLDATEPTPKCPQFNFDNSDGKSHGPIRGQEDCLYLNINVPEKVETMEISIPPKKRY